MKEKPSEIVSLKDKISKVTTKTRKTVQLTKTTVYRTLNGENKSNEFNFTLKLSRDAKLSCTKHPESIVPVIESSGNILIRIHQHENDANNVLNDGYNLRLRQPKAEPQRSKTIKCTTVSELGIFVQKKQLWADCKRQMKSSKLMEGAVVFAKQSGHSPWPSTIISINKSRSSACVKYFGFDDLIGTVKMNEIVELNDGSHEAVGKMIHFTIKTKSARDFVRYERAILEMKGSMGFNCTFAIFIDVLLKLNFI